MMLHCLLLALAASSHHPCREGAQNSGSPADANAVVRFWVDAGPKLWFAKDRSFDRDFRERFLTLHEAAARGEFSG